MPTILIADDYEANRKVLGRLLNHEGYTVVEASDGASALEQVRAERPDVVLVDLLMPVVDGFEFVHRLREESGALARTPVVFITAAYVPSEVTALAHSCGVNQVIARPASFEETLRAIEKTMREEPPTDAALTRPEFRLELLRVLTGALSDHLRTVIPSLAEVVEQVVIGDDAQRPSGQAVDHPADPLPPPSAG